MRKFLTTLFTASALALPAVAAIPDGPAGEGPRARNHARGDANDDDSARPARPAESSRGGRDRPQRAEEPAPAPAASTGPAEWSRHGMNDGGAVPRPADQQSAGGWSRHREGGGTAATQTNDAPRHRDGDWSGTHASTRPQENVTPHRDRPDGSFGNHVASHDQHRSWSRDWRTDRRYDWRDYRQANRTVFRLGTYYDPYGYGYRRWNIGWSMRPSYYRQTYWISDPWRYRLPEVYGPYRWVRYYDDAILVNTWSGEVVDVIYNFFW